jgi:hypothetical protein
MTADWNSAARHVRPPFARLPFRLIDKTMADKFQLSLAPEKLWQAINPWSFYNQGAQLGFVNINLGQTAHPEIEQKVLDEVGSYGRQLGRIGDALEVLIDHFDAKGLGKAEKDALAILKGQLAAIRKVKQRERDGGKPA